MASIMALSVQGGNEACRFCEGKRGEARGRTGRERVLREGREGKGRGEGNEMVLRKEGRKRGRKGGKV